MKDGGQLRGLALLVRYPQWAMKIKFRWSGSRMPASVPPESLKGPISVVFEIDIIFRAFLGLEEN